MYPLLIAGAALVGLPILLHLIMKQEPKRLVFPAVRFLQLKRRTNQRRMRLRHFLLLLLRCLLIALFCAALLQPRVRTSASIPLSGDQPVAAVLILDTTPSMGYAVEGKSRLDEARRRALELLDDLPPGSRVAVLDPAEPGGNWELSVGDARRRVEALKEPRGGGPPITNAILTAYQLLRTVDEETDASEPMPRLVAVFSDRAIESWRADRTADLKKALEQVPQPAVAHLFVDVGVDKPANVAILSAIPRPQLAGQSSPVTVTVTVQAAGPDVPAPVVRATLDNSGSPERKEIAPLTSGTPKAVTFIFKDLKPGWHQVELALETPDRLTFDDRRSVTFRVGEARKILTLVDDPDDAVYWKLAHDEKGDFGCDVRPADRVADFAGYDVVALLSVADPRSPGPGGTTLWQKLGDYVRRGGKVIVMPGEPNPTAYDAGSEATAGVLPAKLARVGGKETGASWVLDEKALRHPFLAPFNEWKLKGNIDVLRNPRRAFKFWEVEGYAPEAVVVSYDTDADPAKRAPAVLEKTFPGGGKVLLLTTRMDSPWDADRKAWNDYWETAESSWPVVFPHLLVRYLLGDSADAVYNFPTGQTVTVPLPPGGLANGKKLILEGPEVRGRDAEPEVGPGQTELRLPPGRTLTPGNYLLRTEDRSWQEGFALGPPGEESNLDKVAVEAIEELFGKDSVIGVERELNLRQSIEGRFNPELRLFPWLLIGVLILFALEGYIANRFYRLRSGG
jgi:hypothetical protein